MKWWAWSRDNRQSPRRFCLVADSERDSYVACMEFVSRTFRNSNQWWYHTLVAVPEGETPTKGKL